MTTKSVYLTALAAVVAALAMSGNANAVLILSNGDLEVFDPNGPAIGHPNPPLIDITRLSLSGGRLYTNQVAGAPFAVGSTVRTVGVYTIGSGINGTNIPAFLPDSSNLNVIFGVEGTIVPAGPPGVVAAKFTVGRAFLVSDVTGQPPGVFYDLNHATTWNFGNEFAEFALGPMDTVVDGSLLGITGHGGTTVDGSGHVSFPFAATNVSGVNPILPLAVQGVLLFGEDSTAAENAGLGFVNPGLGLFTGDSFLRNVDTVPGGLFPKSSEDIVSVTNQTALTTFVAPTAADLAVMDAIGAAAGFTGAFSAGYTPVGVGVAIPTGDFVADITGDLYVGYSDVPEPGSFLLWFVLGGSGLGIVRFSRRGGKTRA